MTFHRADKGSMRCAMAPSAGVSIDQWRPVRLRWLLHDRDSGLMREWISGLEAICTVDATDAVHLGTPHQLPAMLLFLTGRLDERLPHRLVRDGSSCNPMHGVAQHAGDLGRQRGALKRDGLCHVA